jgi:hypothetical protein
MAGILRALRARNWRAGAPAVTAALGAVAAAVIVRYATVAVGTFSIAGMNPHASLHQMTVNLRGLLGYGALIGGVGIRSFSQGRQSGFSQVAHVVGLGVVVAAVGLAAMAAARSGLKALGDIFKSTLSRPSRDMARAEVARLAPELSGAWLEDVVLFGFIGACAIYVSYTLQSSNVYDRYLTSVVIFGSILAARLVGRVAERTKAVRIKAGLVAAASLVLLGYVAGFSGTLGAAPPAQASTALVSYLELHHLSQGIGDYWTSSIATVESSDAVRVRPVTTVPGKGYLRRYNRQMTTTWYGGGFQFFVYNTALPWQSVDESSAVASFGPPRLVTSVGSYRVLTWGHDLSVPADGDAVRYEPAIPAACKQQKCAS